MSAELYNGWYVSPEWSDVGLSTGSYSTYQEHNATLLHDWAIGQGWTENAAAAMIGNIQLESGLDPACSYPKIGNTMATISNTYASNYPDNAYGLVQWKGRGSTDPNNNQLVGYAIRYGYQWYDGEIQLQRLTWEYTNAQKFHPQTVDGVYYTFASFAASTATPETLAKVWMVCYEGTYSKLSNRQNNARMWYNYFAGQPPVPTDWISGEDFATIALSYDGQYIPYSQCDCLDFINLVWHNIPGVASNIDLGRINGRYGTNTLWRSTRTFNTTDPYGRNPTNELWIKDELSIIEAMFGGSLPAGTLLFHQISEAGPPPIPSYYAGDGIGNFAHVGIYCGNNEVMQSGGKDAGSVPGGGVHKSAFDITAWNYAAFCVYVDPTYQPGPGPGPEPGTIESLLLMWTLNNKRRPIKNVRNIF